MDTWLDLFFLLNIAILVMAHELDAIRQHEWRIFFARVPIDDEAGYRLFTALHVPLMIAILWFMPSFRFQVVFDLFLIAHAGVHWILREHPLVTFGNWFSAIWIYGGAILGTVHLGLLMILHG